MAGLFTLLLLLSLVGVVVSFFKPNLLTKKSLTRKGAVGTYTVLALIFLALAIATAETPSKQASVKQVSTQSKTGAPQTKSPEPTKTPIPTVTEPPKPSPPKIDFSGTVDPSFVQQGEKVVITFTIENLDETQTIEGMRILFANKAFLEKGLTIVNVMSGGAYHGRAFEWKNDLMGIPPKEKRNFVIVATANQPGRYESAVTFLNPTGTKPFEAEEELKATLIVY